MSKRKAAISAKELMDQLAEDPEFQQMRAKKDAKARQLRERLDVVLLPMLQQLREAGFYGESIADVVNRYVPLPVALVTILLKCLEECSEERVQESLVRALGAADQSFDGEPLARLFTTTANESLRFAILNTIALVHPTGIDRWLEGIRKIDDYREKLTALGFDRQIKR